MIGRQKKSEREGEQRIEACLMIMIIMIGKELIMKMNIGKNEMIKSAYSIWYLYMTYMIIRNIPI